MVQLLESAKRLLSVPVKKKEPVTPEIIQRFVTQYGSISASLADLRLLILCVLGYAGLFRFNELQFNCAGVIFSLKILSLEFLFNVVRLTHIGTGLGLLKLEL